MPIKFLYVLFVKHITNGFVVLQHNINIFNQDNTVRDKKRLELDEGTVFTVMTERKGL